MTFDVQACDVQIGTTVAQDATSRKSPIPIAVKEFASGETLPLLSTEVWQLCQGWVQISLPLATSHRQILGWLGAPGWLSSTIVTHPHAVLEVLAPVRVVCFDAKAVDTSIALRASLIEQQISWLSQTQTLLAVQSLRRIHDRFFHLLTLLQTTASQPTPHGDRLSLRLTHQQIARAIGANRVTITRLLGQLKQTGQLNIDTQGHFVVSKRIRDPWLT